MTSGRRTRGPRHTELFLVRVWTEKLADAAAPYRADGTDGTTNVHPLPCRGRVQRVADGESYGFDSLQSLMEVLTGLMAGTSPKEMPDAPRGEKRR